MAIKMIESKWCADVGDYRRTYVADTAADVGSLPECCPGSIAFVVGGDVYMVNASGEWGVL